MAGRCPVYVGRAKKTRKDNRTRRHPGRRTFIEFCAEGFSADVIDLRTLMPWDRDMVLDSVRRTHRCLIVHEDLRTGGFGAEIAAVVADEAFLDLDAPIARVTMPDIPSRPPQADGMGLLGDQHPPRSNGWWASERDRGACPRPAGGTKAVVRAWLKQVGEAVAEGDPLVEFETGKVTQEVPAPASGVLAEILLETDAEAVPGALLARISTDAAEARSLGGAQLRPRALCRGRLAALVDRALCRRVARLKHALVPRFAGHACSMGSMLRAFRAAGGTAA